MRFFVPFVSEPGEAELVFAAIREAVRDRKGPLQNQRYAEVTFKDGDGYRTLAVGGRFEGETIMAILRGADAGPFYVCTRSRGILEGDPVEVRTPALGRHFLDLQTRGGGRPESATIPPPLPARGSSAA